VNTPHDVVRAKGGFHRTGQEAKGLAPPSKAMGLVARVPAQDRSEVLVLSDACAADEPKDAVFRGWIRDRYCRARLPTVYTGRTAADGAIDDQRPLPSKAFPP
jgi:hypothetical protein